MPKTIALTLWLSTAPFAAGRDMRLIDAVKNQDRSAVLTLLKEHVDVNAAWGDGSTALHWAAHWDDVETAGLLMAAGAHVNAGTDLGISPLWAACEIGSARMVEKLLAAGADTNATASTGVTTLMMCSKTGSVQAVNALVAKHASVNLKEKARGQTALMWAVSERHPDIVQVLLAHGADVSARTVADELLVNKGEMRYGLSVTEQIAIGGSTSILFAARQGDPESARLLLAAGANVNDALPDGTSALVLAAHSDNGAVAKALLEKGADPNACGSGYTALHAAILRGDIDLVRALLERRANPNTALAQATVVRRNGPDFALPTTLVGATPFLMAAKYGEGAILRMLAAAGADTHSILKDGTTPLLAAASADKAGEHGTNGPLPAAENKASAAVRAVLEVSADVNSEVGATDKAGNTALHLAASRGYLSVVQLLIEKGAKLDAKNKRGQTALTMTRAAARGGDPEDQPRIKNMIDLLHTLGAAE
jgi:ankyrin repeat protein